MNRSYPYIVQELTILYHICINRRNDIENFVELFENGIANYGLIMQMPSYDEMSNDESVWKHIETI